MKNIFILLILIIHGSVSAQDIMISEIMQDPEQVNDNFGEWFEIYNPTMSTIDIQGWTVVGQGNIIDVFINNGGPLNVIAGGRIVLCSNANSALNGGFTCDYEYGSSLNLSNSIDVLVLIDLTSTERDRVTWDNGVTFPDPVGASMLFIGLDTDDNNVGTNWTTSTDVYGDGDFGSPGSQGSGEVPVELLKFEID